MTNVSLFIRISGQPAVKRSKRTASCSWSGTDVVTVLGADLLVRWRSGSIGHDGALVVGTPLLDLVHPDDRAELVRSFRQTRQEPGHGRRVMLRLRNGDAGHRYFEVAVANRLQDPSLRGYVVTMRDISDREDIERERQAMSEQRLRDEAARAQVERLRERLDAQRERQELEQMLQRARRLESVGQLAGGVAHDFNNLLAAILNTAALVRDDLPADSPLQEELAEIEDVRAVAPASCASCCCSPNARRARWRCSTSTRSSTASSG